MSSLTTITEFGVGGSARTLPDEPYLAADCYVQIVNNGPETIYVVSDPDATPDQGNGIQVPAGQTSPQLYVVGTDNSGQGYVRAATSGGTSTCGFLSTTV